MDLKDPQTRAHGAPSSRLLRRLGERPWQALVVYALLVCALYSLAARAPLFHPWVIAPGAWDARVPLSSAALLPYLSYFLLLPALVAGCRRRPAMPRVLAAALACGLVNVALYLALPTRLAARPAAPAGTLLALLQRLDTPLCVLPSGHVALPMSIAVAAWLAARSSGAAGRAWRRTAAAYFAWTLLIAAGAWLTGQHYLIDLAAGIAFGAAMALAVFLGPAPQRPLSEPGDAAGSASGAPGSARKRYT